MTSNVIPLHGGQPALPAAMSVERAVYTVREVAHLLDLSLGSAYSLIRAGEIPARKMGGRWVVPKQRFHTWLNELPPADPADLDERDFTR
jgi:excisionase family DNA binding protein